MEKCYKVYLENDAIGSVTAVQQGLYCCLSCRCKLTDNNMYRLCAQTDTGTVSLGLLCPKGDSFGLETRVPIKKIGQGNIRFAAVLKDAYKTYIPIDSAKPFLYLAQLENCRFVMCDGKPYLRMINEKNG